MSLSTLVRTIQDIMRKDVGVDGDAQRISQMVWLLFLKIFDDKEQEWKITIKGYKSPLQTRFQWSNWAANAEGMTGEELIDFINNDLFPSLKKLATTAGVSPHGKVIGSVFEDAYNYMKSGTLLRQVINTIQGDVDFNSSDDRHIFNDIYEKILSDLQSAGNAGEYYTPRAVTQFMVDILNPQLGEVVFDPACGTGGFLVNVIEHIKKQFKTSKDSAVLQDTIHGVEKKPLPHMLAMTNMMLHGIDVPTNIRHDNTLSRPLKDYGPRDRVDVIITNPPFGGIEEDGIEKNFPKKYQTRETADLFMALIMHLLRPDTGRAAVVLPDGFLFGESTKTNLKKELLEEFNLHTIVRLPKGVFSPYTSINTNILFFEKGSPTKTVWFFEHPYPEGYKSYSKGKPLRIEEFELEKKWWNNRKQSKYAWKISVNEIEARNFNLDFKNPHFINEVHTDPEILIKEYEEIGNQLISTRDSLKKELTQNHEDLSFITHFDKLFSTKESIDRLRKVILSIALKGQLVSQHETDISSINILNSLIKEKNNTGLSKKISKKYDTSKKIVEPFSLPKGWNWCKYLDVAELKHGHQFREFDFTDSGIPVIKITQCKADGTLDLSKCDYIDITRKEEFNDFVIYKGDLLMALTGGTLGKVTKVKEDYGIVVQNYRVGKFVANEKAIKLDFLTLILQSDLFQNLVSSKINQNAQPNVGKEDIENLPIPLPPIKEQERIVEKVNQLFELCNKLEKNIEQFSQKQSQILNAVLAQV
jgi:type I restriction enzyme M protein